MAELFEITNLVDSGISSKDQARYLAKLSKTLAWMLQNLDSLNVTSIDTSITTVSGEDGQTVITGAQIIMKDAGGTTRLIMGSDGTDFKFQLFDDSGVLTLYIDSNGQVVAENASFAGTITGSEIIGGRYYNDDQSTYLDMDQASDIRIVRSSGDGLAIDVESGVAGTVTLLTRTSGTGSIFLTSSGTPAVTTAVGQWSFLQQPTYSGSNLATEFWVDSNYLDQSDGWTGSFTNGDGDTVTVVNGQITNVAP